MSKSYFHLREALEIGTDKIANEYKKATPGQVAEAPEDDMPASPDEAGMAMDQAKFIGYVADEIMEYIQGNNEFPEWMQNKLSALHEKAKGMHAVMAGKYNESHKPSELEKLNEANYQVKAGKHAIGSASYDDKEIVTVTPQQAKKLNSYFQKNKDGDMWKKLFQGGGRGGKGAENQKDFDSMVASLKESTELDEAAFKVPKNYSAMMAKKRKKAGTSEFGSNKVTNAQIHKVLGPTKNAQQGIEALKKAFKVNDKEAEAMLDRVMNEANRGSDSYRVKYKGDINTVRADSPEDALKKTMKAFGISSFNKSDYMKNASAIAEAAMSEKLEVSDGLDVWIKDFQASDAPQFEGKDKEERRNMAIAAYLAAKRDAKKGGDTSESTKAYGKTMSKRRDDKKKAGITDKDKQTLGKLADLMKREKR